MTHPKGYITYGALFIGLLLLIMSPVLYQALQRESRQSVKQVKSTHALLAAQAAMEKVEWRLENDPSLFTSASTGTIRPGYNYDVVHTDITEGEYKVRMSSGPQEGQVTVLVNARDPSRVEDQALEAVYARPMAQGSVYTQNILGNVDQYTAAHWGPIVGSGFLQINNGNGLPDYPRKIASSAIFDNFNHIFTANEEYLPGDTHFLKLDEIMLDFDYYRAKAIRSTVPTSLGSGFIKGNGVPAQATPPGSGLFFHSTGFGETFRFENYVFRDPSAVIMFESNSGNTYSVQLNNSFLQIEALLAYGNAAKIHILPGPANVFGATIPVHAPLEYQHINAQPVWNAGGASSMASIHATPTRCCYNVSNVAFHGFLFSSYRIRPNAATTVGVLLAAESIEYMLNTGYRLYHYFDPEVAMKIKSLHPPKRLHTKEIRLPW